MLIWKEVHLSLCWFKIRFINEFMCSNLAKFSTFSLFYYWFIFFEFCHGFIIVTINLNRFPGFTRRSFLRTSFHLQRANVSKISDVRYAVSLIPWYDVSRIVNYESIRTRFTSCQSSPPVCWSLVLHPVSSSSSRSTEERGEYRNAPDEISLVPREYAYADSSRYESGEISFELQSLEPEETCEYYDVETLLVSGTRDTVPVFYL